jgi:hypothetical protein
VTISNPLTQVRYTGDGASVDFAVTFPFFLESELLVYSRVIATGVQTLLTIDADYTVAGGDGDTGTVTTVATYANTHQVIIQRDTALSQLSDYQNQAAIPAETLEYDFDRAVMRDQEIHERLGRQLRFPDTDDPSLSTILPTSVLRAERLLYFDANGEPSAVEVTDVSPGSIVVGAAGELLLPLATLTEWTDMLGTIINGAFFEKVQAGAVGGRPAAVTFGSGWWADPFTARNYFAFGGAFWIEMGIGQFLHANLPAPAGGANEGRILLDVDQMVFLRDSGTVIEPIVAPFPRGAIGGLGLTYATATSLTIAAGECRVGTAASPSLQNAYLAASMTKSLDVGAWAAGTGVDGRAAGAALLANTWYHVFLIAKVDGSVDVGYDSSVTAVNLLADATVAAAGFVYFRRLGSVLTNGSSQITQFTQVGDEFAWTAVPALVSSGLADQSGSDKTLALTHVPTGFAKLARIRLDLDFDGNNNVVSVVGSYNAIGGNPTNNASPLSLLERVGGSTTDEHVDITVLLDSTNTLKFRAASASQCRLHTQTLGWVDTRGKDL